MNFKTPKFWHKRMSIFSILLIPISWIYRIAHALNMKAQGAPYKSSIPVICVGNAISGGSGKTPSVMALIKLIKENNIAQSPVILTRGYGGDIKEPTFVDFSKHSAVEVGDEALLLAHHAPTIVARNRADGAKFAEENNANLIIMDDGLQNNHLFKDLSFLVVDRQIDFGNNRVLPAGPLREPLSKVLDKVQGIICIGRPFHSDINVFEAVITPTETVDISKNYIAFSGLGYPEKFKNTLLDLDVKLTGWHPFPDHHQYSNQEIEDLSDLAQNKNATLITTEKDFVRLSIEQQQNILTLPIALNFNSNEDIITFLKQKLGNV
jgi:tetraacyldisaccharide 4'-kinase